MNSWWAECLRPPCGGHVGQRLPSRIFTQRLLQRPSPDTSRVIEGFLDLARDLIDLVYITMPRSAAYRHRSSCCLQQPSDDIFHVLPDQYPASVSVVASAIVKRTAAASREPSWAQQGLAGARPARS